MVEQCYECGKSLWKTKPPHNVFKLPLCTNCLRHLSQINKYKNSKISSGNV